MTTQADKYIYWLFGITAVVGVVEPFMSSQYEALGGLAVPHMLAIGFLLFAWCKAHARAANISEPVGSAALCGFIGVVGVPLYFFRAFGFKKGIKLTIKALVVLALCLFIYSVALASGKAMAHNNAFNWTSGSLHAPSAS